jgi:ferredoxin-NADP reductase
MSVVPDRGITCHAAVSRVEQQADLRLKVAGRRQIADRVVEIELTSACGGRLPDWAPGAHVELTLGPGLIRHYSLCSDAGDPQWRVAVLEENPGRGGSAYVHKSLRVGDELSSSAPRNNFPLQLSERPLLFVAGGIGITPILPMVRAAAAAGADWHLLHLARSPGAAVYVDELSPFAGNVTNHVDTDGGPIDLPAALDVLGGNRADVYACGPVGLLSALEEYAAQRSGCRLSLERFVGTPHSPSTGDHAFVVETAGGMAIEVPEETSVLDALTAAGIRILSSCREGVCGTCETPVIDGVPDHRDDVLSDEDRASGETMMVCVSRCIGKRLVLDV